MVAQKSKYAKRLNRTVNLGSILPNITKAAFRKHSFAAADMMLHWQDIVGDELARITVPQRFSNGVLTISCASVIAVELAYQQTALCRRVNTWYGREMVKSLRFIHNSAASRQNIEKKPVRRDAATHHPTSSCPLPDMGDSELRPILERIGAHVLNGD